MSTWSQAIRPSAAGTLALPTHQTCSRTDGFEVTGGAYAAEQVSTPWGRGEGRGRALVSEPNAESSGGRVERLVAKISIAVLAAAVTAALGLRGVGLWDPSSTVLVALVVATAVLAAGSTAATAVSEWRSRRLGARREAADVVLNAAAWAIVDATGLDYRDLGLAAYRTERVWWAPGRHRLRRVHRVRAKRRPTASRVKWAPGKGVIGQCVERGQLVAQDVRADYEAVWPCDQQEWDVVVPPEVRNGLTFEEFLDVREKYDVVVATPVLDDSGPGTRVVGCVALDGPAGSLTTLMVDEVLGLLDSAAQGLLQQTLQA